VVLFSDLPYKLAGHMAATSDHHAGDAAADLLLEIYFRLDARVQHLMLDEFQDTSLDQWAVLDPIASEVAAHVDGFASRTFFCVGDVKQAIYGWRGGCADLLSGMVDRLSLGPGSLVTLAKSYR